MEGEAEWEKEVRVREVLEEIAHGTNIHDSLLVPLMEANKYDVTTCVEALLEMINEGPSSTAQEERQLEEERLFFEECRQAAEASAKLGHSEEVISEELKRKEEADAHRQEMEAAERAHFAQARQDLETEWMARLEEQQRDLEAKQQALEKERQAMLKRQLEAVSNARSVEFKQQVEEALKVRLAEKAAANAAFVKGPAANVKKEGAGASEPKIEVEHKFQPGISVELTCPDQAGIGSRITVFWEYKAGKPSMSDWIGYYKRSRPLDSNQYYTYAKTGGNEKGKLEFTVPAKLGICEFRMFQNNDYKMIARSGPVRVGNKVQLAVSQDNVGTVKVACTYEDKKKQHSSWDWVALYLEGEVDNRAYLSGQSSYVTSDVLTFSIRKPGRYVARYFQSGSGYSDLASSEVFLVDDKDWVKVNTPAAEIRRNAVVEVEWNIESIVPSSRDHVALFRSGEFNPLLPLAIQRTHANQSSGKLQFHLSPGLSAGSFEFVFIAANDPKTPVKKSPPFQLLK